MELFTPYLAHFTRTKEVFEKIIDTNSICINPPTDSISFYKKEIYQSWGDEIGDLVNESLKYLKEKGRYAFLDFERPVCFINCHPSQYREHCLGADGYGTFGVVLDYTKLPSPYNGAIAPVNYIPIIDKGFDYNLPYTRKMIRFLRNIPSIEATIPNHDTCSQQIDESIELSEFKSFLYMHINNAKPFDIKQPNLILKEREWRMTIFQKLELKSEFVKYLIVPEEQLEKYQEKYPSFTILGFNQIVIKYREEVIKEWKIN